MVWSKLKPQPCISKIFCSLHCWNMVARSETSALDMLILLLMVKNDNLKSSDVTNSEINNHIQT